MVKNILTAAALSAAFLLFLGYSAHAEGRPAGCPRLWCGCQARIWAGIASDKFNRALHWLVLPHVGGRSSPPVVGSYAVMRRKGGGHVGLVVGTDPNGNPIIKSGNHRNRVDTSAYPRSKILAYVQP